MVWNKVFNSKYFIEEWYSKSRINKKSRNIIFHLGPTNSGKTFHAIQALKDSFQSSKFNMNSNFKGIYLAPLRLLAIEMYEKLLEEGFDCSLRTGECTKPSPLNYQDKSIQCSTIEMLDPINNSFNVAIVDEFQMLADPQRGHAFTKAIIELNADKIYLCGEESALGLVESICKNDNLEIIKFKRLNELVLQPQSLQGKIGNLKEGDCLISFNRKSIFDYKTKIETLKEAKCAIVYGNLPMENRSRQAEEFNQFKDYKFLIASDAIGMGLNLNIKRIIFTNFQRWNGHSMSSIPPPLIKQISGRAGRFGKVKPFDEPGMVTCLNHQDMSYLTRSFEIPNEPLKKCVILPNKEQFIRANTLDPSLSLHQLFCQLKDMKEFNERDSQIRMTDLVTKMQIAEILKKYHDKISFPDLLNLIHAPLKPDDDSQKMSFFHYISHIPKAIPCPVKIKLPLLSFDSISLSSFNPTKALIKIESIYQTLDLYLWMSGQFPHIFLGKEEAELKKGECGEIIEKILNESCLVGIKKKLISNDLNVDTETRKSISLVNNNQILNSN